MSSDALRNLASEVKAHGFNVDIEWLRVTRSEYQGPNTPELIKAWVVSCFLSADLKKASIGCVPPNLQDLHKTMLSGAFIVQVEHFADISLPSIKSNVDPASGEEKEDSRSELRAKRMYKLLLTDGSREFCGFEYEKVDALTGKLAIGTKLQLRDVPVRNGMLLLANCNTTVLGGYFEDQEIASDNDTDIAPMEDVVSITPTAPNVNPPVQLTGPAAVNMQVPPAPMVNPKSTVIRQQHPPPQAQTIVAHEAQTKPQEQQKVQRSGSVPIVNAAPRAETQAVRGKAQGMNFVYLKDAAPGAVYHVKACVHDLLKFGFSKDKGVYSVKFKIAITDGNTVKVCQIANQYAETYLLHMSAAQLRQLNKKHKDQFTKKMVQVQNELKYLEGIMELKVDNSGEVVILNVHRPEDTAYAAYLLDALGQ